MSQPQRLPERPHRHTATQRVRRGAVLVEFAFVALGFYVLLMGTVEIGRMILSSQLLNNAARVGARELAMMPLPATMTFEQAMDVPIAADATDVISEGARRVRETIYDKNKLAIDVTGMSPAQVQATLDSLPYLNRMLVPLMIRERVTIGGSTYDLVRYPGALVRNTEYGLNFDPSESQNRFDVMIPKIENIGPDGTGLVTWLPVVEEIVPQEALQPPGPGAAPDYRPFSIASQGRATMRGVVCLRINYPYQASMASAFMPSSDGSNTPIIANDGALAAQGSYQTVNGVNSDQPSQSGAYGLGEQYAFGQKVRPYRRIVSAQCIARRETMTPPPLSGN